MPDIGRETGSAEGFGEPGLALEPGRVERYIAVGGVWSHSDVGIAGMQVDRLGAHEDDGIPLLAERFESVE